MAYKLTTSGEILRIADNTVIPANPSLHDYADYLDWLAAGNTPLPADPKPNPIVAQAQSALDKLTGPSGTIMRCVAAGVTVPPAWQSYVKALRAIANGTDTTSTTLPNPPMNADGSINYPAGT